MIEIKFNKQQVKISLAVGVLMSSSMSVNAMGKSLGRPPKNPDKEHESKMTKSVSQRNAVEATFGTAKRVCRANNIRAKLPETANCWTAMCYFVKNVMKFLKELLYGLIFISGLSKIKLFIFGKEKYNVQIDLVRF